MRLGGFGAFPYIFFIHHQVSGGQKREGTYRADRLLVELFTVLVETNYQQQGPVFPSPYIGVEEILAASIPGPAAGSELLRRLRGSSYILRSVLEMLVRRGRRDLVAAKWRQLTATVSRISSFQITLRMFSPGGRKTWDEWDSGFANQTCRAGRPSLRNAATRQAFPPFTRTCVRF